MTKHLLLISPEAEKALHRSISPIIRLDTDDWGEIQERIRGGLRIEAITRRIASGEASIWDALEMLELYGYDMDQWAAEIELNLEHELNRNFSAR